MTRVAPLIRDAGESTTGEAGSTTSKGATAKRPRGPLGLLIARAAWVGAWISQAHQSKGHIMDHQMMMNAAYSGDRIEDDDGVVVGGTVEQIEQAQDAGQPVSLFALSVAQNREKGGAQADKFRTLADAMQKGIDNKFADRQTNTPKRACQAASQRNDGQHLQRTQAALRALADGHDGGTLPGCLASLKSKKAIHDLTSCRIEGNQGYYDAGYDTGVPYQDTEQTRALFAMLKPKTEAETAAENLERRIVDLKFAQIPGYFPTPAGIVAWMIEKADIYAGMRVLEPSAGHGAIVDALQGLGVDVEACEINHTLRGILEDKGINVVGSDFMADDFMPEYYDRILMNPPFERLQDVDHVTRAFDKLGEMGRLVAIMSHSWTFHSTAKAVAFRKLVGEFGAWDEIETGAFKESGTAISAVIVTLDKE